MSIANYIKAPDSTLDYVVDWSDFLDGDTIDTSAWEVSPAGLDITTTPPENTTTASTVWAAGGNSGVTYTLTNTITTNAGRIDSRSITIHVGIRSTMTDLIRELRSYTDTNEGDREVGGSTYWTDEQIQAELDKTRIEVRHHQLTPIRGVEDGAYVVFQYHIPADVGGWIEGGGTVKTVGGSVIPNTLYTMNLNARIVDFGTVNQVGSVYYLDCRVYNLYRAAASIWRQKAGAISATAFDWQSDNHRFSNSQQKQNYIEQAKYYERLSGGNSSVFRRTDEAY